MATDRVLCTYALTYTASCTASNFCVVCWQVDGLENPKVQSVFFPDTPLHKAAFANDGAQVCLTDLLTIPFCVQPDIDCQPWMEL